MSQNYTTSNYYFPITVIGILFFIFGFITWANSQLIPYLREACQLTETESYLVGTAFFAAYFFMALPASYILKKTGFKKGMSLGLFVMAVGALLFIPAAQLRNYPLFLTGLFIIGSGVALLQTASNPYVTILGPIESAARRISIMGICNKLAGISAVYILGFLILKDTDALRESLVYMSESEKNIALQELANRVILPYYILAASFGVLGLGLLFVRLPEVNEQENQDTINEHSWEVLRHRNLVLGALAIFFYVGAEVISYDAFSTLGIELGYSFETSITFTSYIGYTMLLGYLLSIFLIPKYLNQKNALKYSSLLSMVFLLIALFSEGWVAVVFFSLLGLSQAAMWPSIWPLALDGLGKHTKTGSAILVMMIIGGAILLPLMGVIAEWINSSRWAFLVMIPCWLYTYFYAVQGYRSRYVKNSSTTNNI